LRDGRTRRQNFSPYGTVKKSDNPLIHISRWRRQR